MAQKLQVPTSLQQATGDAVPRSLEAIGTAIEDAYTTTRAQMLDGQYHDGVVHTAFAQFLVHNVRDSVAKTKSPGLVSRLALNRAGTAYHEVVYIEDKLFLTISAVTGPGSPPRPASHVRRRCGERVSTYHAHPIVY